MAAEIVEQWLQHGKPADIRGSKFWPLELSVLRGTPVAIQRGQATAFFLRAEDGSRWILKKFHPGRRPDLSYLRAVASVLPDHEAFASGTKRTVLSDGDLQRSQRCYYSSALRTWLDHALLMPKVEGSDWAGAADEIREGRLRLSLEQRFTLCRRLCEVVAMLEQRGCSHRDLSAGNVFLDTSTGDVSLIDFDCVYHTSLSMPKATTCGTDGYAPGFMWKNGRSSPQASWCPHADRFALAVLVVEVMVMEAKTPIGADGGVFGQDELRARSGPGLCLATTKLRPTYPAVFASFEAALNSQNYEDCPSPNDWIRVLDSISAPSRLSLRSLEEIDPEYFVRLLQRRRPRPRTNLLGRFVGWGAGLLQPSPTSSHVNIELPADPWRKSA